MPYIKQADRARLDDYPTSMQTPGELNYMLTTVLHNYYQKRELNYQLINDVVGALESAKCEFQRRVVAPYEDKKIQENGDLS